MARKDRALNELSYAMLAGQVNTTFRVLTPTHAVELELIEADLKPAPARAISERMPQPLGYERFSLIFQGARHEPVPQLIHLFEHPDLGRFEMFIAPVFSPGASWIYYEAVFYRPIPEVPART